MPHSAFGDTPSKARPYVLFKCFYLLVGEEDFNHVTSLDSSPVAGEEDSGTMDEGLEKDDGLPPFLGVGGGRGLDLDEIIRISSTFWS